MSLTNREIRRDARINLTGVYRLGMIAFLLANITTFAIQLPFQSLETANPTTLQQVISYIVTALIALISLLLAVGQCSLHLKLARPNETTLPAPSIVFSCFRNHPDRYLIGGIIIGLMIALCAIPFGAGYLLLRQNKTNFMILVLVALGIISLLAMFYVLTRFVFAFFLMLDQENLSVIDSFKQSLTLTEGHEGQIFLIFLTFVLYDLLSVLSLGFAMLWVAPYEYQILSVTYLDLIGETSNEPVVAPTIDIRIE